MGGGRKKKEMRFSLIVADECDRIRGMKVLKSIKEKRDSKLVKDGFVCSSQ